MPKFIMTVGLPASGKSTWCKQMTNVVYISSDEYREWLLNDVNDQEHNTDVFKAMFDDTIRTLNDGYDVIYDATNINHKRRKYLVSEIKRLCKDVSCECVLFATPYEQCLTNNSQRERKVPKDVIKKMYLNFYIPSYAEGWDNIEIVWWYDYNVDLDELFNTFVGFNQDNSHHDLTLDKHLLKAYSHCLEMNSTLEVEWATLLHDIGKPFTKSFTNYKGEPTTDAHYFNHQNVGAYDSLFVAHNEFDTKSILHIANLIQRHMQPYFMEFDKSKQKFLNMFGREFYDEIMILHECDEFAH